MFRLDPKQAVLDHVAATNAARNGPVVLTEAAERIAAAPIEPTYSGTVIVGIAQAIEALLLATLGFAIYGTYVGGGQEAFYIPVIMGAVLFANVAVQRGAHPSHPRLSHRRQPDSAACLRHGR